MSVCGRRQFSRHVTSSRSNNMLLPETVFLQLAANFATILHLCAQEDDIECAKVLMILAFTYQCEGRYLYQELTSHSIWQSMRFWNAAFLHAVHTERKLRISNSKCFSQQTEDQREEAAEMHKNIFFGQLSSFISNMSAFELPAAQIAEFREKMFQMSDMDTEQMDMLRQISPPVGKAHESEFSFSDQFESFKERSKSMFQSFSRSLSSIEIGHTNSDGADKIATE